MFGAKTPFGATSTFGTGTAFGSQPAASPFGQTAATGTGGSLFGSTNTQQTGFGTFGTSQQPNTALFGSSTNTGTGLFGSSNTSTGSLFGQPASSSSSIFGNNAASTGTSLFGQSSSFGTGSSGFGTTGTVFGTPSTSASTGLFGSGTTGTQSSLFGGGTSGFQSTGGFGSTAQGTAQAGTPIKFNVVSGTDQMVKNGTSTAVSTRHQCITVMKEYDLKSFEELRFEDYNLGRKTGPSGATGGLFSGTTATTTSASTGGLFGSSTNTFSAFSQPKTGFGNTGSSLFGQTNQTQQTGGLFGSKPTGLFGASTATTASTGFGSSGFGTTAPTGGLFGQTSSTGQTGGLFGTTTTTQSGGLFGAGTTGFGQSTTGAGLFGQSSFGNTQQTGAFQNKLGTGSTFGTSGSLFGTQNKPATSGFGGLGTTSGFGVSNNNSLFGKSSFGTTNTLGAGFGAGTTGTNLFGAGTNTGLNTAGSSFGTGLATQSGFGTFGQTGNPASFGSNTLIGSQTNAQGLAQQQQQQLLLNQQILALNNSPFGDSKLFRNSLTDKPGKAVTATTASSQHVLGSPSHYKVSSKLTAKIKPRPINHHTMNKSKLFEGLDDDVGLSPDSFVPRKSIKKLIIRNKTVEEQDSPSNSGIQRQVQISPESPIVNGSDKSNTTSPMGVRFSTGTRRSKTVTSETRNVVIKDNLANNGGESNVENHVDESVRLEPCGVILNRPEYYTVPPINELNDIIDSSGEVWVNDFVVGREGYGEVKFLGKTNVADLNLDDIVFFRRREIEVYPESFPNKPPVGEGLNKKAEITLQNVWPNDKTTHKPIKTPERLRLQGWLEKVEAATANLDATFLDYRPETGTWVFIVEHFTKYGIHEFLEAEHLAKKQKKAMFNLDSVSEKQDVQKDTLIDEEEKMLIAQSLKKQQAQIEAFEQEKERAATESMQDQDSDIDDLDQQTFPDDVLGDEEHFGELPASHQLATVLGVSAHRMQVMKASFFGETQQTFPPSKQSLTSSHDTRQSLQPFAMLTDDKDHAMFGSPKRDIIGKSVLLPHAIVSDSPSSKLMHPSAIGSAVDRGAKLVGARAKQRGLVSKDKSITNNKEHFIGDLGLVMGRSFRVGWGPGFVFVHSGSPEGKKTDKTSNIVMSSVTEDVLLPKSRLAQEAKDGLSPFGLVKERVNIASYLTKENESALMQHVMGLEVELEHSKSSCQSGCPLFEPSPGTETIHHHANMCKKNIDSFISGPLQDTAKHMSLVWDLVVALWGQQEETDLDSYNNHMTRRQALCSWLATACEEKVKAEVDEENFEESDYLKAIWSHLTGGQINQACCLAKKHNDYRLAMLLAQATGHRHGRQLLQKQLHDWELLKADNYITDERLKIVALLAGVLVWRTSTDTLNTCEGLDWKRTFGVHMLYQSSPCASIAEVLSNYEDSYKGNSNYGCYGAPPCPPYLEDSQNISESVQDTCYHLVKLYCERSHSLEKALAPSTYTPYQLDYRQSWHLSLAMASLGYSHLSSYHAGLIHTSFAAQLETMGLWQWAAFVLLHLADDTKREHSIRSLLYRHCHLSTTAEYIKKEEFLQEKLHIPPEWIHEAKAIRAMYLDIPEQQAVHLLKSQQWNRCHEIVINRLASSAITNEEYDDLHSLLSELEPRERCCTIMNWSTGGQVILDFLKVNGKFKHLAEGTLEPTKYNFEELHMLLSSLCNRIANLPSTTAQDRLCQYELAQKCANYLKLVTLELDGLSEDTWLPTGAVVPHISQLPLPEDCALAELRDLTTRYVEEI